MHGTAPGLFPVPIGTYGGLVTLADPSSVPIGASPRTYDTKYLVGSVGTRDGLSSVYAVVDSVAGPNPSSLATSAQWLNPSNITVLDGSYTSFAPVNAPNTLTLTEFTFNIPPTDSLTGIVLTVIGFSNAPASLTAQLTINGMPVGTPKTKLLPQTAGTILFGSDIDLWGATPSADSANSLTFGFILTAGSTGFDGATALLDFATVSLGLNTGTSNFQFLTTFNDQKGNVKNLLLDAAGNLWVEDVTNAPYELELARAGITPNSYATGVNLAGVEFLSLTNGFTGADMPLQYTPDWIDRITQVGPAMAPTFTPITASTTSYPIVNITQPAAQSRGSSYFLWSNGPGSTAAGNVITFYYSDSTLSGPDTDLVNAFNSGFPVYVYASFSGTSSPFAAQVVRVTSVGEAAPPGQPRAFYYFTFTITAVGNEYFPGSGHPGYTANYQRTLATLTTSVPVPGLVVGSLMTVSANSVANWNTSWTVSETPNSSQMAITGSQVSSGVATLNYSVTAGSSPPTAGQPVTITNTLNAGGALNAANATIVSVTGGTTGTFTLNVSTPDFPFEPESGLATTAGTLFDFDPGAALLGTATNPIYGTGTGGALTFNPSGISIDPGTYQGTVFYITRNGAFTFPAPPVTFDVPANVTSLQVTNLLIGPPNVVARGIAITEAGQNGVPGANFFTLPTPVTFYKSNVAYTATSFYVNDNMTSSVTLSFTGAVLLNGLAIDVYGYNLFNNIEIGDPGWVGNYADRNWYGLCINKVQNFNNLSFDGGYLSGQAVPSYWTRPDAYGSLVASPKFGQSYYILNNSDGTLPVAGLISQTAFQDAYQQAILNPNTTYSARITASNPGGIKGGNLVIALTSAGVTVGSCTLPLSALTTELGIFNLPLLTTKLAPVPANLTLSVSATNLAAGADILLDRFDVFPTEIPVLTTTIFGSYAGLYEQVDAVTGRVQFTSENQQAVNGMMVMYDTLYALKGWSGKTPGSSLYSLQKSSNLEPADWTEPEVAQRGGGAVGPMAFDLGEQWFLGASRAGLYLFVGGQPGKISQEIYQVWDAINWAYGHTIWVKADTANRVLYVGVPLATPNFWLPNAPVNENPTSPNVILTCDYKGVDSGEQLRSEPMMHTTMFGTLNAIDMRRKWSILQIPSPYGAIVQTANDAQFYLGNGRGNSKVYKLDPNAATDDGLAIDSLYTTAGLPENSKRAEMPQLGPNRIRWGHVSGDMSSGGNVQLRLLPNKLLGPGDPTNGYLAWTSPGGITPGSDFDDFELSLNFAATRAFLEFRQNDGKSGWNLSNLTLQARKDVWNVHRGRTS